MAKTVNKRTTNLLELIVEASDLELQRKLWRGHLQPDSHSHSFVELQIALFDEIAIEDLLGSEWASAGLDDALKTPLSTFMIALDTYKLPAASKQGSEDQFIINDPAWATVVQHARHTLDLWQQHHPKMVEASTLAAELSAPSA